MKQKLELKEEEEEKKQFNNNSGRLNPHFQ